MLSSTDVIRFCAEDDLTRIGEALQQIGVISLHLQARAWLQDQTPNPVLADADGAIARSAVATRSNLAAMSRYCLQNIVPRTHVLAGQLDTVATATARIVAEQPADLRCALGAIVAELDRCCVGLRAYARSWPRGAGMIRMSEQRLWGALAAELHRVEGPEGPIMRRCGEIERVAFDLAQAIEQVLGPTETDPSAGWHVCNRLLLAIRAAAGNAIHTRDEALFVPLEFPGIAAKVSHLAYEYALLADASPHLAQAIAIATEANAQSHLASRLRDVLSKLESHLSALAADYRGMSRTADRASHRAAIIERVGRDGAGWGAAMAGLQSPACHALEPPQPPRPASFQVAGRLGTGPAITA